MPPRMIQGPAATRARETTGRYPGHPARVVPPLRVANVAPASCRPTITEVVGRLAAATAVAARAGIDVREGVEQRYVRESWRTFVLATSRISSPWPERMLRVAQTVKPLA